MNNNFYVAAYEARLQNSPVAVWASARENPLQLDSKVSQIVDNRTHDKQALSLNQRFRFYRYKQNDFFTHGEHPLHSGTTVTQGVKYIIRTDVMFKL